jgi:hypothetical protein
MATKQNTMSHPTVAGGPLKREKINIFKIGRVWCFKHFFDDKELFKELYKYYNSDQYRFEMPTVGERNKIIKCLERKGFELALIEDLSNYTVTLEIFKKYALILRNSIDHNVKGNIRIFVMNDLVSVEEAIAAGAKKYKE